MKVKSTIEDYYNESDKITVKSCDLGYGNVEVSINNGDTIKVNGRQLMKAIENALNH